jgi:hypothetical protein
MRTRFTVGKNSQFVICIGSEGDTREKSSVTSDTRQ